MQHVASRVHDMGGLDGPPVERAEHEYAPWEKKVDAILRLLLAKKVMTLDELRRGIEDLGPGAYDELSYFERWIASIANNEWLVMINCECWARSRARSAKHSAA